MESRKRKRNDVSTPSAAVKRVKEENDTKELNQSLLKRIMMQKKYKKSLGIHKANVIKKKYNVMGRKNRSIRSKHPIPIANYERVLMYKRKAVNVIRNLLKSIELSRHNRAFLFLQEFGNNYLPSLDEECALVVPQLLLGATSCNHPSLSIEIMRYVLTIMEKSSSPTLWTNILTILTSEHRSEADLLEFEYLDIYILPLFSTALKRGFLKPNELTYEVLQIARRALTGDSDARQRSTSVAFHTARVIYNAAESENNEDYRDLEKLLCKMTSDSDRRVRNVAIEGLFELSKLDDGLTILTYNTVRHLLQDSSRDVRISSLRILLSFALKMPEVMVTGIGLQNKETSLHLCDDAFSHVCHAINDMEVIVRCEAATLLGKFEQVSDSFLDQTLDKKMMRSIKDWRGEETVGRVQTSFFALTQQSAWKQPRWKVGHIAALQAKGKSVADKQSSANEWSSGKELNAVCPTGPSTSDDDDTIIPRGACGAFVSALEDEFMVVRKAAVYSLGRLAANRPLFASTALDHLADMFNDEIAEVRLDSIHALTPLVVHGQLLKEQLETILKCLDDAMLESRQALRDLLAKGEFADVECMKLCTRALINCLQRFPSDKNLIYQCLAELGRKHGVFVHAMVKGLLDLPSVFEPQEQNIGDVFYMAKLIIVLNGASNHEPVISMLPGYVLKHYRFMRAAMPHLVPPIPSVDANSERRLLNITRDDEKKEKVDIVLNTYDRLRDAQNQHGILERNLLRRYIVEDCNAISSFNAPLAGASRFVASLSEICSTLESLSYTILYGGDLSSVSTTLQQELISLHSAEHRFSGIDSIVKSFLIESRLYLSLLAEMVHLMISVGHYIKPSRAIKRAIEQAEEAWKDIDSLPSDTAASLITEIGSVLAGRTNLEGKKILTSGALGHLLEKYMPILPKICPGINEIHSKWAQITEPDKDKALEKSVRFVAGLPTAVPFSVVLHNLTPEDLLRLRIQIDYPDQTRAFCRPRSSEFAHQPIYSTVTTNVLLSTLQAWSDSATVCLTVVLMTTTHIPVPLFDSPTRSELCCIRVRIHPMNRV